MCTGVNLGFLMAFIVIGVLVGGYFTWLDGGGDE